MQCNAFAADQSKYMRTRINAHVLECLDSWAGKSWDS